jgi:hypothetical protein
VLASPVYRREKERPSWETAPGNANTWAKGLEDSIADIRYEVIGQRNCFHLNYISNFPPYFRLFLYGRGASLLLEISSRHVYTHPRMPYT